MDRIPASSRPFSGGALVKAQPSWRDVADGTNELVVPFTSADAALAYARTMPVATWPIVDVIDRAAGRVIAARRMVAHPAMPGMPLSDTIAEGA